MTSKLGRPALVEPKLDADYLPNTFEKVNCDYSGSSLNVSVEGTELAGSQSMGSINVLCSEWAQSFSATTIKYLVYLYDKVPTFKEYCNKPEFIDDLVKGLFPESVFSCGGATASRSLDRNESKTLREVSKALLKRSNESLGSKPSESESIPETVPN